MRKITTIAAVGCVTLVAAACGDDLLVPDFNNPGFEELQENPTRQSVISATQGLFVQTRDEFDDRNGYVSLLGILGRESYNFDGSDPRFVTEMLEGTLNPSSPAFGGNLWGDRYAPIRTGTVILNALPKLTEAEMSTGEKEAVLGFVKTWQAHELLLVVNTRDTNGAVVELDFDPSGDPPPLVPRNQALTAVADLLDEAAGHLDAADDAGASFPHEFTSGFSGFDTPSSFRTFNRALLARVEVYRENYQAALDALAESFIDPDGDLDLGAYHVFGEGAGDFINDLHDPGDEPDILAHPSLLADAESRPGGGLDLRAESKLRTLDASQTVREITTNLAFDIYTSLSSPVPIIRNEELILLRAEARLFTSQIAEAAEDVNRIRTRSGGLAQRTDLDAGNLLDEILFQRQYSLMFEGGHRWIDARRHDRLTDLPQDRPNHNFNARFPIPEQECLARGQETCSAGS